MGKKLFVAMIVVVVTMFAGYNIYASQKSIVASDLALANVEALASSELTIGCDNYSVVIKCEKACTSCWRMWTAINGYGNPSKLSGRCLCGREY